MSSSPLIIYLFSMMNYVISDYRNIVHMFEPQIVSSFEDPRVQDVYARLK